MTVSSVTVNLTKAETSVVRGAGQISISLTGKMPNKHFFETMLHVLSYLITKKMMCPCWLFPQTYSFMYSDQVVSHSRTYQQFIVENGLELKLTK